ncbi:MAG TPA: hypothetical protein VNN06_08285 [Ramlibacter sp.]|nr:hypothetical protein [Ramlibacter sp.]
MSLFSWLFPARKPPKPQAESSGLSRMEATRPVGKRQGINEPEGANGQPANRKTERMARRELLYTVVREAMMRAGVLSASYKFKVLSLDARGRQFLVMVDLARDHGGETARLAEIEAAIAQAAKSRYDIVVTAVYWRTNEHVAIGDPGARAQRGTDSQPVPLDALPDSGPAPLGAQPEVPAPAARRRTSSPYEQIQADEVEAFKRALAAGVANPAAAAAAAVGVSHGASAKAFDGSGMHGPQSYTLLTGFEDTEMPDPDQRRPTLSGTQYGDLH